jgi:acyl transferase domain-containing protein
VVPKPPVVVALHGTDRADLASALDTIAIMASRLSSTDLHEFAQQLAADEASTKAIGPLRVAILAEDPPQLAARAQRAADLTRAAALGTTRAEPGLFLSENATGRVALLLSGLAETAVQHAAAFAACRAALTWLDHAKVTPAAVVGYGIGEIVALAWADCLTMADAAFLIARRAEVLRAAPRDIAFARLEATKEMTKELIEGTRLVVTSTEGEHQRLIAGPVPAIREMMDRAGTRHLRSVHIGTAATELAPAMRDAATAVRFRPPRRRVISATWGRELTPEDDLAGLIGAHLATPNRLADALAATTADLLIAPAELAGAAPGPVVETPDPRVPASVAAARAALFAAGALTQPS